MVHRKQLHHPLHELIMFRIGDFPTEPADALKYIYRRVLAAVG
ncbi:hypothetical protein ES703_117136 [subsurface metagenome]